MEMYLITRLDELIFVLVGVVIISLFLGGLFLAFYYDAKSEWNSSIKYLNASNRLTKEDSDRFFEKMEDLKDKYVAMLNKEMKRAKLLFLSAFIISLSTVMVPSEKDMAIIYSGSFLLNSKEAKDIPDKVLKVINHWLEDSMPKEDE